MPYLFVLCTLLLLSPNAVANKIYTWLDADNVRHFSDSPPAEHIPKDELTMPELPSMTPVAPPAHNASANVMNNDARPASVPLAPQKVTFTNITNQQTIRSNQGNITIKAELARKAQIGEQLQLLLNNSPYNAPQTQTQWQLKNIDRGTHTLQIQVVNSGKVIALSDPMTVHLHRASRNNRG
ncbi:DUF4124 domain-containing protein [Vibrio sp. Of7-15]|uniref:DUF4124 domain-containing protein n=1 Tax=Vibrio sp. Of7-15 TaxID=2724879 RepID=UPI001EF29F46|nr:DUF4124 domain-containing protein [Vibrio sp. Of7-15]MCG7496760.1 DUF4124 domain-containing protein [Vibrio sp. Of7-15]